MSDREEFLGWVNGDLYKAELALQNGDAAPRRALWSHSDPVSVFGAMRNVRGQRALNTLFHDLGRMFADCTSYRFELLSSDVIGDMAYTVGLEHISGTTNGQPTSDVLRVTQVYRREDGHWRVVHRHADADWSRTERDGV